MSNKIFVPSFFLFCLRSSLKKSSGKLKSSLSTQLCFRWPLGNYPFGFIPPKAPLILWYWYFVSGTLIFLVEWWAVSWESMSRILILSESYFDSHLIVIPKASIWGQLSRRRLEHSDVIQTIGNNLSGPKWLHSVELFAFLPFCTVDRGTLLQSIYKMFPSHYRSSIFHRIHNTFSCLFKIQ